MLPAMFEIVTGEGYTYGPLTQMELREAVAKIPSWVCWHVRVVGCE